MALQEERPGPGAASQVTLFEAQGMLGRPLSPEVESLVEEVKQMDEAGAVEDPDMLLNFSCKAAEV